MKLQTKYNELADRMAETLFDDNLSLEDFIPALCSAVRSRAKTIRDEADDYEVEHFVWAEGQEKEAALMLDGIGTCIGQLDAAIVQSLPSDDQIIIGAIKASSALLKNIRRRMDYLGA